MFAYQKVLNVDNTIGENMIQKTKIEFYNLHILSRGTKIVYVKVILGRTEKIVIKLLCHMLTMYCILNNNSQSLFSPAR